jgi:hypothetical protein
VFVDRLKSSLALAAAIVVGTLLGTGWVLTWAKLHYEELPSQSILAALPHSYFIGVALHSAFVPVLMASVLGSAWVLLSLRHRRRSDVGKGFGVLQWSGFGAVLVATVWLLTLASDASQPRRLHFVGWQVLVGAFCILLAAVAGLIDRRLPRATQAGRAEGASRVTSVAGGRGSARGGANREFGSLAPLISTTVVLVVLVASVLRVSDAYFGADVLPVAEVVLDTPCSDLSGGISPFPKSATDRRHCLVAGFYLGESSRWVYLVQSKDPCRRSRLSRTSQRPLPSQLVAVKLEHVQELVVLSKPPCRRGERACTPC